MSVSLPLSPLFSLLVLMLPGIWRLGLWQAGRAVDDPALARAMAPGLALASWLLAVHLLASATGGFATAMVLGTIAPGLLGYGLWRRAALPSGAPQPRALVVVAALGMVVILPAVVGWDFFDRFPLGTTHFSLPAQILNGIYPPRELSFPAWTMRYHLGIDLLVAMVTVLTRLRVDVVLDLLTAMLWPYTLLLAGLVAARLYGPRAAVPGAVIMCFLGRLPLFVPDGHLTNQLLGLATVGGDGLRHILNPSLPSYFFQPAWTIGLPLFMIALLLAERAEAALHRRAVAAALAVILMALAIGNTTLFLCLAGALAGAGLWQAARQRQGAATLLAVAAALAAAPLLGGMLPLVAEEVGAAGSGLRLAEGGKAGTWAASLAWNMLTFGLALPLGLWGLLRLPRLRLMLLLLFGGSFAIVNLVEFTRSWDIVKFGTVAALALAIGATGVVVRMRRPAALLAVALLTGGGFAFHVPFWLNLPDIPADPYMPRVAAISAFNAATPDELRAVGWLRRHVAAGEAVLCPPRLRTACSQGGGLPEFHVVDFFPAHMGIPRAAIDRRLALQERMPDPETLRRLHVAWALLPGEEGAWAQAGQAWAAAGDAEVAAALGDVRVLRLDGNPARLLKTPLSWAK